MWSGKRVVANLQVRVTEQSLIAREYAEGLPCKSNTVVFAQGKRHYLVSAYPFLCVTRETSTRKTRKFACRLHIAIDIRRGSRKIAETILRKDTALSRFIYFVVASSRDRAIFDCEGIRRGSRKNVKTTRQYHVRRKKHERQKLCSRFLQYSRIR